jgi:soluble lytic murein transglycosylase
MARPWGGIEGVHPAVGQRRGWLKAVALALSAGMLLTSCAPLPAATPAVTPAPTPTPTMAPVAVPATAMPTAELTPTAEPDPQAVEGAAPGEATPWPICTEMIANDRLRVETLRLLDRGEHEELAALLLPRRGTADAEAEAVDLCLASAHLADGDLAKGVELVLPWAETSGPMQHQALAMLAAAYEQAGQWQPATKVYAMLLALEPPARPYVLWRAARANVQAGADGEALRLLREIDTPALPPTFRAQVLEEVARLARERNQWELAIAAIDEIQSFAAQPAYRMLVEVERARTLLSIGEVEPALEILTQAMVEYPEQAAGQQALAIVREQAGDDPEEEQPRLVAPLIEARVLHHAGQNEAAEDAIRAALKTRDADRADAYALRGLILASRGQPRSALAELDRAITLYNQRGQPADAVSLRRVAEVWFAKAQVVAQNNGDPSKVYTLFASRYADHPDAPRALLLAARYLAEHEQPSRAADLYARIAAEYPDSALADDAGLQAGLVHYQHTEAVRALDAWTQELQRLEARSSSEAARARLLVWLGIARRDSGDLIGAGEAWHQAMALTPDGYWGLRATDLMAGASLRLGLTAAMPAASAPTDWEAIAAWLDGWAEPVADSLASQVRAGLWMWRVGWQADAVSTLNGLALREQGNPALLGYMAQECDAAGNRYIAGVAAEYLIREGQRQQAPEPPLDLWRVAYPLGYEELVAEYAERYGLDPLLFCALIRQESRFYARAVSSAGARGLTQVMPATGEWIAESIGPDDYHEALLWRPYLNLRYGAWYLNYGLGLRGRDWPAALVAYNAGPGSLDLLTEGREIVDYDLFVETLPYSETKAYITSVYRQYRIYQRLYR